MVTQSITLNDALEQLRPHLSDDFLRIWRKVTLELGFRQVGRALTRVKAAELPQVAVPVADWRGTLVCDPAKLVQSLARPRLTPISNRRKGEKRNPAGGLYVPQPGGYQREAGTAFLICARKGVTHEQDGRRTPHDEKALQLWSKAATA